MQKSALAQEITKSSIHGPKLKDAIAKLTMPWLSSNEEKLEAISLLEKHSSREAIDALRAGLELACTPLFQKGIAPPRPRGGKICAKAALALASIENELGTQILINAVSSRDNSPLIREAAAFGLANSRSMQAIYGISLAMSDPEAFVRETALAAAEKILDSHQRPSLRTAEALTRALAEMLRDDRDIIANPNRKLSLARLIELLELNLTPSAFHILADTLGNSDDVHLSIIAINILKKSRIPDADRVLAACLQRKGQHPAVYQALAQMLRQSTTGVVAETASNILDESLIVEKIFILLQPAKAESLYARLEAAEALANG